MIYLSLLHPGIESGFMKIPDFWISLTVAAEYDRSVATVELSLLICFVGAAYAHVRKLVDLDLIQHRRRATLMGIFVHLSVANPSAYLAG